SVFRWPMIGSMAWRRLSCLLSCAVSRLGLPFVCLAHEPMRHARFDLLPRHARGQHRQRMAQVDRLINASTEEIVGSRAREHHGKTPSKQPLLDNKLGVMDIGYSPDALCLCEVWGLFRDDQIAIELINSMPARSR